MASKTTRVFSSILAAAAVLIGSFATITLAEDYYTAADEEYMRKQAEKYYTPDNPTADYVDSETGEIAWKAVPPELKQQVAQKEKESQRVSLQKDHTAEEDIKKQQEMRHSINSYSASAAVDWGIPAIVIPRAIVPGTEGTIWELPKPFTVASPNIVYEVISQGTEIRIALLMDRVDLPEGVTGQLTRPVYNSRGEEIFPQAAQIFGRYNYYDQAVVWKYILLAGETVQLENPEEFSTAIGLTERTEPGYRLLIHVKKTILVKIPRM